MIQIYNPGNLEFDKNGDAVLFPESATVHAILNGDWEVSMTHPIDDGGRWRYIKDESVIKMPSFNGQQLFRVKNKIKSESGIEITAVPIFLDARDNCFLDDIRPTEKNGQQALDLMTAPNNKYMGESDIKGISTAYYQYKNLIEAINGNDSNAFIKRWGGEVLYDNYKVIINNRVGGDYGAKILYGKNIKADGIEEEIDFREVVTRIYPKSYNGYMMSNHGYVDSGFINKYPTVKSRTITFEDVKMREDAQEDDEANGVVICDTQAQLDSALRKKCQEQFEAGIDRPSVSMSIDIVMLQNTEEYKNYSVLETLSFGDTVHCEHYALGIDTDARVVELEWDSIQEKVTNVVIGDFTYNYFKDVDSKVDRIEKAIRPDGSIVAEEIRGLINAMNASLQLQSTAAKKVDGRAFLIEDLDADSGLFGAMEAGTQGFRISNKRNPDNRSWVWTTAITALGIIADTIISGSITSQNWRKDTAGFRLDLDNGTINSKHLKLDANGLMTIYKALIDGGEMSIKAPDGEEIFRVDENGAVVGADGKAIRYNASTGLLSIYKALITGGEITIKDNNGNRIFRVSENEGFIFGDGENGTIKYDIADRILKLYKDTRLYGRIDNYAENGKRSVSIGNNSIEMYSWMEDGNFIGALASEVGGDGDGGDAISLVCDSDDQMTLAYYTGEVTPDGRKRVGHFMRFDPSQVGNNPLDYSSERAIKMAEIPRITGAWNGTVTLGPLAINFRSGIVVTVKSEGTVWSGKFKTGAQEDVAVTRGAITSVG